MKPRSKPPKWATKRITLNSPEVRCANPNFYGILDKASKMISSTKWAINKYSSHKRTFSSENNSKQIKSLNWRQNFGNNGSLPQGQFISNSRDEFSQNINKTSQKYHGSNCISPFNEPLNPSELWDFKPVSVKLQNFMPKEQEFQKFRTINHSQPDKSNMVTETEEEYSQQQRDEKLWDLKTICSVLKINKYYNILQKNEIEIEDLFMLTEKDLLEMKFSIGAKNRLIQFLEYFKKGNESNLNDKKVWK